MKKLTKIIYKETNGWLAQNIIEGRLSKESEKRFKHHDREFVYKINYIAFRPKQLFLYTIVVILLVILFIVLSQSGKL